MTGDRAHQFRPRRLWLTAPAGGERHPYQAQLQRADLLEKTGEWGLAEAACRASADWCRRNGFRAELAEAIVWLCRLRRNMGKGDGQLPLVRESLEICEALGDRRGVIRGHVNLGLVHALEGRLAEAAAEYRNAIALAGQTGLEWLSVSALGNLAQVLMLQGDYAESIAVNQRVIELGRAHGDDHSVANAHCNLGNVYFYQGRYDRAMECYRFQASLSRACGDIHAYSVAAGNIGNVHYQTGDPARAMERYREKLALSERLGFATGIGQALGNIANILLDAGDVDGAIACDNRVLAIADHSGDAELQASGCIDLGCLLQIKGDDAAALAMLDRAVAICRVSGVAYDLAMALVKRADARLRLGDREGARADAAEGRAAAGRIGDDGIALEGALIGARAEDDAGRGTALIEELVAACRQEEHRAMALYELALLGGGPERCRRALEACRSLEQRGPNYVNTLRVRELERRCPAGP
ncbi:MAG: tetratricopeptide repeat protein [Candidatus Edwardsbacteria bacterium]|jgi:tetratricopeptide (TPR) repeat protein|nr:tetratricopeptide repeat protein [Candidatus Edwardsbacteria bacterium]